ncbi:RnfH family protein [Shewanella sp. Choline-02u-19]|jgi:putative ubiquitin-RnfH superfamily antitoxin RatB of RatAB toxin-antitoxin module|uniref:RnfH family protein n=1 Tax=unclassified Shewanella TaxID=196818 RepID=UPI000C3482D2|nr:MULTISPECIES: RnfH family protein [unclassified Shewanella]PKG59259.1 RnfH family protein [Shewanella sp. GutDb-MelDb]PKG74789.1 RnfH family protein [Shewanella sp. GutCb]PKH54249.1 RnfH family protein [Shewanella sp. Bg11-22]PKI28220.1 RnfH family protein [Shewanella sp. Choline-02u-19]
MNTDQAQFTVEIIYALPQQQKRIKVNIEPGTTCIDAVKQSDMQRYFPEIDLETVKLGIFSRSVKHAEVLQPGQRVEIYRALIADPKDVRRKRAEKAKDEGRVNKITGAKL